MFIIPYKFFHNIQFLCCEPMFSLTYSYCEWIIKEFSRHTLVNVKLFPQYCPISCLHLCQILTQLNAMKLGFSLNWWAIFEDSHISTIYNNRGLNSSNFHCPRSAWSQLYPILLILTTPIILCHVVNLYTQTLGTITNSGAVLNRDNWH